MVGQFDMSHACAARVDLRRGRIGFGRWSGQVLGAGLAQVEEKLGPGAPGPACHADGGTGAVALDESLDPL